MCVNEQRLTDRLNSNLTASQRYSNSSADGTAVFNILCSVLAIFCLFILGSVGSSVHAAVVGGKMLCEGTPVTTCTAPPNNPSVGAPVYYSFTIDNIGGPQDKVDLTENYPTSFTLANPGTPAVCSVTQGSSVTVTTTLQSPIGQSPLILIVDVPPNSIVTCVIAGYFNTVGAVAVNTVVGPSGTPSQVNTVVDNSGVLPTDLTIVKSVVSPLSASINLSGGPQTVRYRIEVTTSKEIYLGDYIRIYDQLQLFPSSIPIEATYVNGSLKCYLDPPGASSPQICQEDTPLSGTVQSSSWQDFVSWGPVPNQSIFLTLGSTLVLEYDVEYDVNDDFTCVVEEDAEGIENHAFLGLAGNGQAINDENNSNNDTINTSTLTPITIETGIDNVDPNCIPIIGGGPPPLITLEKLRYYPLNWEPPTILFSPSWISRFFILINTWFSRNDIVDWGNNVDYYIRITNTSPNTLSHIKLEDLINNLPNTPNFKVTLTEAEFLHCPTGSTCTQTAPNPPTPPSGPIQNILSFYDTASVWKADIFQLAPNESAVMKIVVKIGEPWCDSSSVLQPKNIRNLITAKYFTVTFTPGSPLAVFTNYTLSDSRDIEMENPEPCDFGVTKTVLGSNKVEFGVPLTYDVKYTNAGNTEVQIGTLIDVLRIANNFYAVELPITYSYTCTVGLSPTLGVTGFSASGSGTGFLNYVSAPHQGIRVMDHPGFVTFPPNSTLNCKLTVTIDKPAPSDPYCFSDGNPEIQNLALMDGSLFYNANLPWAPSQEGSNWATVNSPLPKCYNLAVNKSVTPIVTAPNGGPLTYTISVTNPNIPNTNGDINFPPGTGPTLTDEFTSVLPVDTPTLLPTDPCQASNTHPCDWLPSFGLNPTKMAISELVAGDSIVYSYQVAAPYNPHELCNKVNAEMLLDGEPDNNWYEKNPAVLQDKVCVPIRGSLEVTKTFASGSQAPLPGAVFEVQVNCIAPAGLTNVSGTLSLTPGALSAVLNSIPIGSNCTITEQIPDPASLPVGCVWDAPKYPDGQAILVNGTMDPHQLSVENSITCKPCLSNSPPLAIDKNTLSCADAKSDCTFEIILENIGSNPFNCPVSIRDAFHHEPQDPSPTATYNPSPGWVCIPEGQGTGPNSFRWTALCKTTSGNNIQIPPSGKYALSLDIKAQTPSGLTAVIENCVQLISPTQNPQAEDCTFFP